MAVNRVRETINCAIATPLALQVLGRGGTSVYCRGYRLENNRHRTDLGVRIVPGTPLDSKHAYSGRISLNL